MSFTKKTLLSIAAAAAITTGLYSPAIADSAKLDLADPTVKAQLDAYMDAWIQQNAGRVFEEVQKHLAAEEAKSQPQYADFVAKIDALLAADAPHEGADLESAKIFFVEFFDYNCPFCQALHKEIRKLQQDPSLADVAYVYRDLPVLEGGTHTSFTAAHAARAADMQGKFTEYTNLTWSFPSHGVTEEGLVEFAKQAGLSMEKFNADRNSDAVKKAVAADYEMGSNLRINGTPFIFIWSAEHKKGGIIGGMAPAEQIKQLIDALKSGQDVAQ